MVVGLGKYDRLHDGEGGVYSCLGCEFRTGSIV